MHSKKVAEMFNTEAVIVVGSQAVLLKWGDKSPDAMRTSKEIDMYPANKTLWEEAERRKTKEDPSYIEASEHIHHIAGEGSAFDEIHGFYIDGVDETTSPLPLKWQERALYREVQLSNGETVTGVSPAIEDTIASKLVRLEEKDIDFVKAAYFFQAFDIDDIKDRMQAIEPFESYTKEYLDACRVKAFSFLDAFEKQPVKNPLNALEKMLSRIIPDYPEDTHCAFYNLSDNSVTIRRWEPDLGIYLKVDNPDGPAIVAKGFQHYAIEGEKIEKDDWEKRIESNAYSKVRQTPPWVR